MAPICPKLGALLGACALAALAEAAPATNTGALPDFSGLPVQLEAAGGSEMDLQTRELILKKVVISQGTMRISAERAPGVMPLLHGARREGDALAPIPDLSCLTSNGDVRSISVRCPCLTDRVRN